MLRGKKMSSKKIEDACKLIQENWDDIRQTYAQCNPGKYLDLTCVYRSPDEQLEDFKKGRELDAQGNWVVKDKSQVLTNVDGFKVLGAHNYMPSRAIDVVVFDNQSGKALWEEIHYHSLVEIAERCGLVSGATWKSIKDYDHIEIKDYKNYHGD